MDKLLEVAGRQITLELSDIKAKTAENVQAAKEKKAAMGLLRSSAMIQEMVSIYKEEVNGSRPSTHENVIRGFLQPRHR